MSDKPEPTRRKNPTVPSIKGSKRRNGADPIVMVTAYDAPSARVATEAEVDMILVGDSLAMVVLGYESTIEVTVHDIAYHLAAVRRARPDALVIGDMPWMSFHLNTESTILNAAELIRAGAGAVKIEGGTKRVPMVEALTNAEIPVMGHIGLTPQSIHAMGGFKIQGRAQAAVLDLIDDAVALQAAGCFAIVVEAVPDLVGTMITDAIDIPTIGIGAGAGCDGQVLVYHDLIGLENRMKPRFVRRYGNAYDEQVAALRSYGEDVRKGNFPGPDESYQATDELSEALGLYGAGAKPDTQN